LQQTLERLNDNFCRQHALYLIFTEDGDTQLSAEIYINLHNNTDSSDWHQDPFPSSIFQELFAKLDKLLSIVTEMLPGRERVITLLSMRLTETYNLALR
jgi:hypothetical protein